MNEIRKSPSVRAATQAAEGLPRWQWTLQEFDRLAELGIFTEDDRIELIGGEIVPMSPKGNRHEIVRGKLLNFLFRHLPDGLQLFSEPGWRPDGKTYLEPEVLICRDGLLANSVPPGEVLLLIEVADTSYGFDTGRKAEVYAALGVRDYWVLNTNTLITRVHREPGGSRFANVNEVVASELLSPHLIPRLSLKLDDLALGGSIAE